MSHSAPRRLAAKLRSGASPACASSPAPRRAWKNRVRPARRRRAWRVSSQPSSVVTRRSSRVAHPRLPGAQRGQPARRSVAPHQQGPGRGPARARALDQRPEQRDPKAPGDHREHEIIHVARSNLPVRPVERERPCPGRADQLREDRRGPVRPEIDVLEEPLQAAVGRGDQNPPRTRAGDMAEVDGARANHAHDQHAERLQPALAEADMAS